MRYHFEKPELYANQRGKVYICDHPVYSRCTLYRIGDNRLAVIQQRFDKSSKTTWWGEVDVWVTDAIYLHANFRQLFEVRSGPCKNGLFPTITVRQIMWALKMKPLPKQCWETVFDRKDI